MHRHSLTVVAVVAVVAAALYTAAPTTRAEDLQSLPFAIGETVTFSFVGGGSRDCVASDVRGTFVKCVDPGMDTRFARPTQESWFNLQTITDVTRKIRR
jgi:hypothetical protein